MSGKISIIGCCQDEGASFSAIKELQGVAVDSTRGLVPVFSKYYSGLRENSEILLSECPGVSVIVELGNGGNFFSIPLLNASRNGIRYAPIRESKFNETELEMLKSVGGDIIGLEMTLKNAFEYIGTSSFAKESKLWTLFEIADSERPAPFIYLLKELWNYMGQSDRLLVQSQHPFETEALADALGFSFVKSWSLLDPQTSLILFARSESPFQINGSQIEKQMKEAWQFSDMVFDLLAPSGFSQQPISLRHPFLFYLGHLPAFGNNQAINALRLKPSINPDYDIIFERGIDPDVEDPTKCHAHSELPPQWPTIQQVLEYRSQVRKIILESIDLILNLENLPRMAQKGRVFSLIAEHDYMHAETLLYMYNQMEIQHKNLPPKEKLNFRLHKSCVQKGQMILIPSGKVRMGAKYSNLRFGWDNEFPEKEEEVEAFKIDQLPVTNGEYLKFVESGEYQDPKYWIPEFFAWKEKIGLSHPNSWNKTSDGAWEVKTISGSIPMDLAVDWPVYVSQAEAQAYANFVGKSLPTESQFHRAAYGTYEGEIRPYPWGSEDPKPGVHGNFHFYSMAPNPVGSHPEGKSCFGVYELVGNGWEWTRTIFDGFPGFSTNIPTYPGYSADFFDGKHFVMLGASWATASPLVRRSFRNWFQPNYQYTFSKFRCVSKEEAE